MQVKYELEQSYLTSIKRTGPAGQEQRLKQQIPAILPALNHSVLTTARGRFDKTLLSPQKTPSWWVPSFIPQIGLKKLDPATNFHPSMQNSDCPQSTKKCNPISKTCALTISKCFWLRFKAQHF